MLKPCPNHMWFLINEAYDCAGVWKCSKLCSLALGVHFLGMFHYISSIGTLKYQVWTNRYSDWVKITYIFCRHIKPSSNHRNKTHISLKLQLPLNEPTIELYIYRHSTNIEKIRTTIKQQLGNALRGHWMTDKVK